MDAYERGRHEADKYGLTISTVPCSFSEVASYIKLSVEVIMLCMVSGVESKLVLLPASYAESYCMGNSSNPAAKGSPCKFQALFEVCSGYWL